MSSPDPRYHCLSASLAFTFSVCKLGCCYSSGMPWGLDPSMHARTGQMAPCICPRRWGSCGRRGVDSPRLGRATGRRAPDGRAVCMSVHMPLRHRAWHRRAELQRLRLHHRPVGRACCLLNCWYGHLLQLLLHNRRHMKQPLAASALQEGTAPIVSFDE